MSQQWGRPGVYTLQPQTLAPGQNGNGQSGPQDVSAVPANGETHYSFNKLVGTSPATVQWVEDPTAGARPLASRKTIELFNAGGANFEVDTNSTFIYGTTGRVIVPGGSISYQVDATVKHYVQCIAGSTCDIRVTEVGGPS